MAEDYIRGVVTLDGQAQEDATVKIRQQDGGHVAYETTDENGEYEFTADQLASGEHPYQVTCRFKSSGDTLWVALPHYDVTAEGS